MKKLTILFLLVPVLAFANDISTIAGKAISAVSTIAGKAKADIATVGGGGVPAAGGCATDTLTIGDADESGATEVGVDGSYLYFSGYIAAETCTVDEVRIKVSTAAARNLRAAIYADSAGSPTGDDLGQSAATATAGAGLETLSLTISPAVSITASTRYWIAIWVSQAGTNLYHNGDVANGTGYTSDAYSASGDFPAVSGYNDWDKQFVAAGYAQ